MQSLYDQEAFGAGPGQLLQALAEQLKSPLMHIARTAELSREDTAKNQTTHLQHIELTADTAIRLIDNYLLSMRLSSNQQALELEPVSITSVLNDTAHQLSRLAKHYNIELALHIGGKYGPVMAHKTALEAALMSLGSVLIESERPPEASRTMALSVYKSGKKGLTAGVFADIEGLSSGAYRRARQLYGRSRQPLQSVTAATGAGIFVADSLFNAMESELYVARRQHMSGLAAALMPSKQLRLV